MTFIFSLNKFLTFKLLIFERLNSLIRVRLKSRKTSMSTPLIDSTNVSRAGNNSVHSRFVHLRWGYAHFMSQYADQNRSIFQIHLKEDHDKIQLNWILVCLFSFSWLKIWIVRSNTCQYSIKLDFYLVSYDQMNPNKMSGSDYHNKRRNKHTLARVNKIALGRRRGQSNSVPVSEKMNF